MGKIDLDKIGKIVNELNQEGAVCQDNGQATEVVTHTFEDYEKIEDQFIRYRVMIDDAIGLYNQARLMASVSDTGLSASINRMAEPFRKGFFTLAVVGKMSAGKSTFINALLSDNGLLPTGHFQTTCTITTIQHSEDRKLHVIYGDNHEEEYTDNISETLKKLVAIPEEYKDLPINNINRLILYDIAPEEITGERLVNEMKKLSKKEINIELLKKYIDEHPKNMIPKAVGIECPLNENYRGWRIVDTPGVDAIGGIEDDTKQFLCGSDDEGNHNVDAIIFIQAAQANIEDLHLNEFVDTTINSLTEEAKKRTFFILTHGSDQAFLRNKDAIMNEARRLFVDYSKIGINNERLVVVDSIASLLEEDDLLDLKSLLFESKPAYWDEKEWEVCQDLLFQVESILRHREKTEVNNENMRRKLAELANFSTLRSLLNSFVQEEKCNAFRDIIDLIEKDLSQCISIREKDIQILRNNLGKNPEEFLEDLEKEKEKLDDFQLTANNKMRDIRNANSKSIVSKKFGDKISKDLDLNTFMNLPSLNQMRRKAEEMGELAKSVEKGIVEHIKEEVKDLINTSQISLNIVLPSIDVDQIEHDAKKESTTYSTETYRVRKKTGVGNRVGRFFGGLFNKDWGYETATRTIAHTDVEKEHKLAAESVFKNLKLNLDTYQENVQKELNIIIDYVDNQIKAAIKSRKTSYDEMAKGTNIISHINKKEEEISSLQKTVEQLTFYK